MNTENNMKVLEALQTFVNQRPGFDPRNYGSAAGYREDYAPVLKDKAAFREMARYCELFSVDLEKYAKENTTGRLTYDAEKGRFDYCTGQYFPVEFRAAACRFIAGAIWDYWRACDYDNGDKLRKKARKEFSRRTASRFFN